LSVDRALRELVNSGKLRKLKPSLYYLPRESRWGAVPATLENLVSTFLKSTNYLMLTSADYNSLGLVLNQLWNEVRIYNNKRHKKLKLANYNCVFQRPNNGFSAKITKEFILVDLLNNINDVGEDPDVLKGRVIKNINKFDAKKLKKLSVQYGKVGTKKIIDRIVI